ncbi:CND2 [Enterospora canceri]|uniref:Condensin complex subunit 2 n=1 Tax=Enterospora canceri TaxID=1081671 RepID=A0A1Y1S614_9MICR|nr:CND2 [Enterospora canceri]
MEKQDKELEKWIKAANENKISAKNAWNAPLIQHFNNIDGFREENKINFTKVSTALDGCVKVYTNRVDEVADSTYKLVNIMGKDEETKEKQKTKTKTKKDNFLVKNTDAINIRIPETEQFNDPVFSAILSKNDVAFVFYDLKHTNQGILLHSSNNCFTELIMEDEECDIEIEKRPICSDLLHVKKLDYDDEVVQDQQPDQSEMMLVPREKLPGLSQLIENISHREDESLKEISQNEFDEACEFEHAEESASVEVNKIEEKQEEIKRPFIKKWNDIEEWRTEYIKKKPTTIKKKREKAFLDFKAQPKLKCMREQFDSTMTKEMILNRRKKKNVLTNEFLIDLKDLYRMNIDKEVYFGKKTKKSNENTVEESAYETNNITVSNEMNNGFEEEFNDEPEVNNTIVNIEDANLSKKIQFDQTVVPNEPIQLKFTRKAKKVDMLKLKTNLFKRIEKLPTIEFNSLCTDIKSDYTSKEYKDISKHTCLIGLLHLATENNLELECNNNHIQITRK